MTMIFHLHHYCFFTISVPLFCLIFSWATSTTTPSPTSPSPSALAAASTLQSRGYALFAATIINAASTGSFNGTGTILAPLDFALSFPNAKFNFRLLPRLSTSLFLYHTLKRPFTWSNLTSHESGDEFRTHHFQNCLFLFKSTNGELSVSESRRPVSAVKIRHPDLYIDDNLTVHGVDGVLDTNFASRCSHLDQSSKIKYQIQRSVLDQAIRAMKRKGFNIAATAMAVKRPELMSLTALTIFAPSDKRLLVESDGFHYDFLHHVVPKRMRYSNLARFPDGAEIETMARKKRLAIGSSDAGIEVSGVTVNNFEIYHNRWIVVMSISRSLDDATYSLETDRLFSTEFPNPRQSFPCPVQSNIIDL